MSATESISNTDNVNYLNIVLILLSCGVAFYVPFELFLFSYAILGPAHYLTEISWLHKRNYFLKGKHDYVLLVAVTLVLCFLEYAGLYLKIFDAQARGKIATVAMFIAFSASLAMVVLKDPFHRLIAFVVIAAGAFAAPRGDLFFYVFLPTLIHVFVFTGLFMLYGALKGRSNSGYLSCLVFVLGPLLVVFIAPKTTPLTSYALEHYKVFHLLNVEVMRLFNAGVFKIFNPPIDAVYKSDLGLAVMRFIAFAYTYHYLNWFSKTSVIKWHQVPIKRLMIIGALWIGSVAFYIYDYKVGFRVLFLLSQLHVILEFPLNHVSIIGIFKEIGAIRGTPASVRGG